MIFPISVVLYYEIGHFCPLKAIFTHFLPFDQMFGSGIHYHHLLVQLRHVRSLFIPLGTNDWAKSNPPRIRDLYSKTFENSQNNFFY